jgi:hypothetical protein
MTPRRFLTLFLGALTVLRLILAGQVELTPDESYYFQWSQHLDLSYYSKGPGIALAMWPGTHIFGATEFGVRVLVPLLSLGTSLLAAGLARRLYGESIAVWTVVLMNCTPIFNAGSLLMTIDPLSIFFWMAALYTAWLALEKSPAFSKWWPLTGALIGLGFLAKYTNAMQLLSIVLLLALTPKYRRELRQPGFFAMLGVFLLFTIPVLVWNARYGWVTLHHLGERGGLSEGPRFRPGDFFIYLGLHLGVYSPLIFAAMLGAIGWSWRKAALHFKPRFLLAFSLPLLVMYFGLALKRAGEPNWTAPASVSLAVLTVAWFHELTAQRKWARTYSMAALVIGATMSLLMLDTDILRSMRLPLSYDADTTARLRGWRTSAEAIEALRLKFEREQGAPVFLIANKYGTAAGIAFYLRDKHREGSGHPPIYCPESATFENQFSFWPRYDGNADLTDIARDLLAKTNGPAHDELAASLAALNAAVPANDPDAAVENRRRFFRALKVVDPQLPIDDSFTAALGFSQFAGRTALYITDRPERRPASSIEKGFARTEMIASIDVTRRGLPLRQLRVFACYDYRQSEL